MNRVRSGFEVTLCCFEYARHKGLRVSINDRKPAALYLYHDAMTLFERMVLCM